MFKVCFVSIPRLIFLSNDSYHSPTKVSTKQFLFVEDNWIKKTFCFDPCIEFVTVQISQKVQFFDFVRYSNLKLWATTSSISSIKMLIGSTSLVHNFSTKKSLFFSLASVSWKSENCEKKLIWFFSIFRLKCHQNYRFYLFDQDQHRKKL